jgi:hypothetical protein
MNTTIQTGLRVSEELDAQISKIAHECNISKNNAAKVLIALGIKAYQNINCQIPEESLHSVFHNQQ